MNKHNSDYPNDSSVLNKDEVYAILKLAFKQDSLQPLCSTDAVTHAAGTAVVGYAGRSISSDLCLLRDVAEVCCGEMTVEKLYTVGKLIEHTMIANMFVGMVSSLWSNPLDFGVVVNEQHDFNNPCLIGLVGQNLPVQFQEFQSLMDDFGEQIMYKMQEHLVKAGTAGWEIKKEDEETILPLLREAIQHLWGIKVALEEIIKELELILSRVHNDWQTNAKKASHCDEGH